jgi:transposase-like protein
MRAPCANNLCTHYQTNHFVILDGYFKRRDDGQVIRRFKCKSCLKRFSHATSSLEYKQKKRSKNLLISNLLSSGISMRRCALVLKINRKTVERKLKFLAMKARLTQSTFLESLKNQKLQNLQFDDLITNEHTKLKPLSVPIVVDPVSRKIIALEVSSIAAFGHLSKISKKKYGKRKNNHKEKLMDLFEKIKPIVDEKALIRSDEHRSYKEIINYYFPESHYKQYKSRRAYIAGQGEMKVGGNDPLFYINHTCAMLRANVNRLIRRSWCTTKNPERLKDHLDIFVSFYNHQYLNT